MPIVKKGDFKIYREAVGIVDENQRRKEQERVIKLSQEFIPEEDDMLGEILDQTQEMNNNLTNLNDNTLNDHTYQDLTMMNQMSPVIQHDQRNQSNSPGKYEPPVATLDLTHSP